MRNQRVSKLATRDPEPASDPSAAERKAKMDRVRSFQKGGPPKPPAKKRAPHTRTLARRDPSMPAPEAREPGQRTFPDYPFHGNCKVCKIINLDREAWVELNRMLLNGLHVLAVHRYIVERGIENVSYDSLRKHKVHLSAWDRETVKYAMAAEAWNHVVKDADPNEIALTALNQVAAFIQSLLAELDPESGAKPSRTRSQTLMRLLEMQGENAVRIARVGHMNTQRELNQKRLLLAELDLARKAGDVKGRARAAYMLVYHRLRPESQRDVDEQVAALKTELGSASKQKGLPS